MRAVPKVAFFDIRPLAVTQHNLSERRGSILNLPIADATVKSLLCLHIADHVGLGRYGDRLDPSGTQRAAKELIRVLAPGGTLYFSLPVGRRRVEFSTHRVHGVLQILEYFGGMNLVQFSIITEDGTFKGDVSTAGWETQNHACGLFWFRKQ